MLPDTTAKKEQYALERISYMAEAVRHMASDAIADQTNDALVLRALTTIEALNSLICWTATRYGDDGESNEDLLLDPGLLEAFKPGSQRNELEVVA